jgi:hypothetical protein
MIDAYPVNYNSTTAYISDHRLGIEFRKCRGSDGHCGHIYH